MKATNLVSSRKQNYATHTYEEYSDDFLAMLIQPFTCTQEFARISSIQRVPLQLLKQKLIDKPYRK